MMITKNKVVVLEYVLSDDSGKVIVSSKDGEPMQYIHGSGDMLPGLEQALEGKQSGERVQATVPPSGAYGPRHDDLVIEVQRDQFEDPDQLEVGMQIHLLSPEGSYIASVIDIAGDDVTLDANHPLAGVTLQFDVKIVEVRDASPEELESGRVAGDEDGAEDEDGDED